MANPPVDFRLLAGAAAPARDCKAGDVIFKQGDPAQELFIIQSGEVEIRLGIVSSRRYRNTAFSEKWP
jgi:CRP-like cAMP-binding protein